MLTITISPRVAIAALAAGAVALALMVYVSDAFGAGDVPEQVIQGDINCDGVVDANDALGVLRHSSGLSVDQVLPCPDVGTLAAIPGPTGPAGPAGSPGPTGPAGMPGAPGISLFASLRGSGGIQSGTAVDSALDGDVYYVTFDRDITHCAAVASQGTTTANVASGFNTNALMHAVQLGIGEGAVLDSQSVAVSFRREDTGMAAQTDFHLVVAC